MHPAPSEVTRGAHYRRIDIGPGQHAAAQEDSNLVRIDLVVFRLAAVNGVPIKGVSEHEGDALAGAQVRQSGSR